MAKNKILITSKLIGSLILSFSVNECWFVVCKQKAEVLYAFRKRKLLHSLDKAKLCPHWSHAHLTVSSQIHDKPPANIYCILETHATTCSTWPAPGHTVSSVSIAGCVNHAGRAGWKAARSLPICSRSLRAQHCSLALFLWRQSVSEWPCWCGGQGTTSWDLKKFPVQIGWFLFSLMALLRQVTVQTQ